MHPASIPYPAFHEQEGELWCEGVRLSQIGDAVGTPCYVYSETDIRERYKKFTEAFARLPYRVFYSVKANHNTSVLRVIRDLGAGVDVVSLGELERAHRAGFAGQDIVFGGVGKRRDELEAALAAGVLLLNVESESELQQLSAIAVERKDHASVGIRVNPGVEVSTHLYTQTGHYGSKFGVAREDVGDLFELAAELDNVEAIGIAAHIGSQIHEPEPYLETLETLAELLQSLGRRGFNPLYLDIGGGFGVRHEGGPGIDLEVVAEAAGRVTQEFGITLLLEPGRWLVSPAGVLLTTVLYSKRLGPRSYYVTDAASNDFVRPSYYSAVHPIEAVRRGELTTVADVVGPVCEAGDFLGRDCELPSLREGDLLAVLFAGAYGSVMSSNYNSRLRAAEVLVRGSEFRLVRRAETLDDLLALEVEIRE